MISGDTLMGSGKLRRQTSTCEIRYVPDLHLHIDT